MIAAAGFSDLQPSVFSPAASSDENIEKQIKQLERRREDYENKKDLTNKAAQEKKINELDNKINILRDRLNIKSEKADSGECQTCKNRKYMDGSNDPGVSFKTPTKAGAGNEEAAVRGHEYEHVNRNQAKAAREGDEIVYQSVLIKHAICPECGKSYASGGETITVTRHKPETEPDIFLADKFKVGLEGDEKEKGTLLDVVA